MTRKDYQLISSTLADVLEAAEHWSSFNEAERTAARRAVAEVTMRLGEAFLDDNSRFDFGRFAGAVGLRFSVLGPIDAATGELI
jgi:hypothetical protein